MAKTALITGITGQDGSYLAELLLAKGYRVVGLTRRSSTRLEGIHPDVPSLEQVELVQGDLLDQSSLLAALESASPDEVYNLAGTSYVPTSWSQPVVTGEFTALGVVRMLEAIRSVNPDIRFYQASSSEVFGNTPNVPQTEGSVFCPRNPYGAAKAYGHYVTVNYRENLGLYAVSGILYNHESPRRGLEFVSRKVTDAVARISAGLTHELRMGNLDAQRDWGFAGDYVRAMWLMLQQETPSDYLVATGLLHSVRDLCKIAFECADLDYEDYVVIDPELYRPVESAQLLGDPTKVRVELGWSPAVDFPALIAMMVEADMERVRLQSGSGGSPVAT